MICKGRKLRQSNAAFRGRIWGEGRQVTSGYSFSDWWLLTDPCDCDWQALTTTLLALASPHCWAQRVVWRLAEIPNKMDITGKNNSRSRRGECWARSTPPSHNVPGFTDSALFRNCRIWSHTQANILLKKQVLSRYALWSNKWSPKQDSENQKL